MKAAYLAAQDLSHRLVQPSAEWRLAPQPVAQQSLGRKGRSVQQVPGHEVARKEEQRLSARRVLTPKDLGLAHLGPLERALEKAAMLAVAHLVLPCAV